MDATNYYYLSMDAAAERGGLVAAGASAVGSAGPRLGAPNRGRGTGWLAFGGTWDEPSIILT